MGRKPVHHPSILAGGHFVEEGYRDFPTNGEHGVNGYPARSYSTGDR